MTNSDRKPLKPLSRSRYSATPTDKRPGAFLEGRNDAERGAQTAAAWYVWQRSAFNGALTPLFAREGDASCAIGVDTARAVTWMGEAVGLNVLKYVPLAPFCSYDRIEAAMAMRHCSLGHALEFEWEELTKIQKARRDMLPEMEVVAELVERLGIPPKLAKMLADVALEASYLVGMRSMDHARAIDLETYRGIGKSALAMGDARTALAAQKAITVTQGTAKQSASAPLTLEQIFRTMRELDSTFKDSDPEPPALPFTPTTNRDAGTDSDPERD